MKQLSPIQKLSRYSVAYLIILGQLGLPLASYGQRLAIDPNAQRAQQPGIVHAPNGVPQVNITAPNAAGVSHNQYQHFNVDQQGLILNNSRVNANTQLSGWIEGNPNLGWGEARIILNEVTGGNSSMLQGYIEVAGRRAEVIIANPAGIAVNGAGFINASGVTLTTGKPQFNNTGHLDSFRVGGGNAKVTIGGDGLDTSTADYTRIIARAIEVNSGVWANDLKIAAGTGDFAPDGTPLRLTVEDEDGKPLFAIDVADLGGMYAGKIHLIGTETGVGVRNAGAIGATVGQAIVTADGQLVNSGNINAQTNIQLQADQIDNSGTIYSQGKLTASAVELDNSGILGASKDLSVQATNIHNQQSGFIAAGMNTQGELSNQGTLDIQAQNTLNNEGVLGSGQSVSITADQVDNSGTVSGGSINLNAQQLTNSDTIYGNNVSLNAQNLDNTGTVYGEDRLIITADSISNQQGQIIGSNSVHLKAQELKNQSGQISAGQTLSISKDGANAGVSIDNTGGSIITAGRADIKATELKNNGGEILGQDQINLHIQNNYNHAADANIISNKNLNLTVDGTLTNQGELFASQNLNLKVQSLDNTQSGDINAGITNITASNTITNRGIIDGIGTYLDANKVTNIGTGRIYGDHIGIQADTLDNKSEGSTSASIAARERLDIGAREIYNRDHSLIYSDGDMKIGGSLDADHLAQGSADLLRNEGATIEAGGTMVINAARIENVNTNYTQQTVSATDGIERWSVLANGKEYFPEDIYVFNTKFQTKLHAKDMTADEFVAWLVLWDNAGMLTMSDGGNAIVFEFYRYYETYHAPETVTSQAGQILAGGDMIITGNIHNDKSRILAGQNMDITGSVNTVDAKGDTYRIRNGFLFFTSIPTGSKREWMLMGGKLTGQEDIQTVSLMVTDPTGYVNDLGGTGTITVPQESGGANISTTRPNLNLPSESIYTVIPGVGSQYLIETDPRFTNYGNFISSNYMLEALGLDPAMIQKRMGDGFYEQKLVREQIGKLTGYRFLAGYNSDDEQYKELMNAGVEFAQEHNLSVGIALTAEQMQALTTDIIWLVSQDVTLPDGRVESVLVPQVYTRSSASLINTEGSLISAENVYIGDKDNRHNVMNQATIAARETLAIDAANVQNMTGQLHGKDLIIQSQNNIDNVGGVISAQDNLVLEAEKDINITSNVHAVMGSNSWGTTVGNTGTVYVTGISGQEGTGNILMNAGNDVNLTGATVINAAKPTVDANGKATGGSTNIVAGNDININTIETVHQSAAMANSKNWSIQSRVEHTGSDVVSTGDVNMVAGNNLGIVSGNIVSAEGNFNASAESINITAARNIYIGGNNSYKKSRGTLRSRSNNTMYVTGSEELSGSNILAQEVNLNSTNDLNIQASNIIGNKDVNLISQKGDVNVIAGIEGKTTLVHAKDKQRGLLKSSAFGFAVGKIKQENNMGVLQMSAKSSSVGSIGGNLNISAAEGSYNQIGSNVSALDGDINVVAQDINVIEAREASMHMDHSKTKSTMLTVSAVPAIVTSAQATIAAAQQVVKKAENLGSGNILSTIKDGASIFSDGKKVISGAKDAYNNNMEYLTGEEAMKTAAQNARKEAEAKAKEANATADEITAAGDKAQSAIETAYKEGGWNTDFLSMGADNPGLIEVSIGFNVNKNESLSLKMYDTSSDSSMIAGGNVNLVATGKDGQAGSGNILVQGSNIAAGKDINMQAKNNIAIKAAENSGVALSNKKSSAIGLNAYMNNSQGIGGSITGSKSNSFGLETSTTWSGSNVSAGGNINLLAQGRDGEVGSGNILVAGSNVKAGSDITMQAKNNIEIKAVENSNKDLSNARSSGWGVTANLGKEGAITGGITQNKKADDGIDGNTSWVSSNVQAGGNLTLVATGDENQAGSGNILIHGSNVSSAQDLSMLAKNDIEIKAVQSTEQKLTHAEAKDKAISVGYKSNQAASPTRYAIEASASKKSDSSYGIQNKTSWTGSNIVAGGNVTMIAEGNKNQSNSGNILIEGSNVTAIGNIDMMAQNNIEVKAVENVSHTVSTNRNSELSLSGKRDSALGGSKEAAADASIYASIASGKGSSLSNKIETTWTGSQLSAGGSINMLATGTGGDAKSGNILIHGSNVDAKENVNLIANNEVNVLAVADTVYRFDQNNSSKLSVGAGVSTPSMKDSSGTTSTGIDVEVRVGAERNKGRGVEIGQTWNGSHVNAGDTLTVVSGGDTNLIGSQLIGNKVQANVGGDLNIESLQDTVVSSDKQNNSQGSVAVSYGTSGWGVSGNYSGSSGHADGDYASVNEYAGIMAGDGGFNIVVDGNTDLTAGLIVSTKKAVDEAKNQLTTGSITHKDLENWNQYEADGDSISLGGGINYQDPTASAGKLAAMNGGAGPTEAQKVAMETAKAKAGRNTTKDGYNTQFTHVLPLGYDILRPFLDAEKDKDEYSTTVSGISGGQITITNEGQQKQLTGQTAEEAIASINRDATTGMSTEGLERTWDTQAAVKEMTETMTKVQSEVSKFFGETLPKKYPYDPEAAKALREMEVAGLKEKLSTGIAEGSLSFYKEFEYKVRIFTRERIENPLHNVGNSIYNMTPSRLFQDFMDNKLNGANANTSSISNVEASPVVIN